MNFLKNYIYGIVFLLITVSSCSPTPITPPSSVSTGDYYPMAVNNEWTYTNGLVTNIGKILSTEVIAGKTYFYFGQAPISSASSNGQSTTWVRKEGANYYQRISINTSTALYNVQTTPFEFILLKDDLNAGDTWTENITNVYQYTPLTSTTPAYPDVTLNFVYNFKIEGKGITKTVSGTTYNDVIQVSLTFTYNGNTSVTNTYFAKDVGVIFIEQPGNLTSSLLNYTLY